MLIIISETNILKNYDIFEEYLLKKWTEFTKQSKEEIKKKIDSQEFVEKTQKLKDKYNSLNKIFQYVDFLTKTKDRGSETDYTTSLLNQLKHINMNNMLQIDNDFLQWVIPKLPHIETQADRFKLFYESFYRVHFPDYANALIDGMRKIIDYKKDEYTNMSPYEYTSKGIGLVNPLNDEYTLPKAQAFGEGVGLNVCFNWLEPGPDNRTVRAK